MSSSFQKTCSSTQLLNPAGALLNSSVEFRNVCYMIRIGILRSAKQCKRQIRMRLLTTACQTWTQKNMISGTCPSFKKLYGLRKPPYATACICLVINLFLYALCQRKRWMAENGSNIQTLPNWLYSIFLNYSFIKVYHWHLTFLTRLHYMATTLFHIYTITSPWYLRACCLASTMQLFQQD